MIGERLSAAGYVNYIGLQCMQMHKSLLTNLDIIITYYCIEEVLVRGGSPLRCKALFSSSGLSYQRFRVYFSQK